MPDIKQRELKMQEKRKQTSFRDFIKEIASWFNANFYKNQGIVSRFPETKRCGKIYEAAEYRQKFTDGFPWIDVELHTPFLQQLQNFFIASPKMALLIYDNNENVRYADTVYGAKNSYMTTSVWDICENVLYSIMIFGNCTNVINSILITSNCENIYFSMNITDSFNIFYSKYVHNSANVRFSDNLIGCQECIFCSWLENKQYHINNTLYTKEEYHKEKEKVLAKKSEYISFFKNLSHEASSRSVKNCSWNGISFSENLENAYFVSRVVHGRNIIGWDGSPLANNLYDVVDISKVDDAYGRMWVWQNSTHMYCWANTATGNHIYYSYFMDTCSYCLWCIWLKNKQFCIFNKEYSKEERYALADKIFEKMEADWTLWAFFPATMNPFYFNDTLAYLIDDSFTKEEVIKEWYLRRDEEMKADVPEWAEIISSSPSPFSCREGEDLSKRIHEIVKENRIYGESWWHQVGFAREMRKNPTKVEEILWEILRNRNFLWSKRRRQFPINKYIADFYCHDAKLILELDGSIHNLEHQKEIDDRKDEDIYKLWYKILRFKNRDIYDKLEYVLKEIADHLGPSQQERGIRGEEKTLDNYQWFDENWKRTINPEILKKVIRDEKWNYYRIVKMEYDFLMKYGLPLPELHRLERIKLGFKFK